MPSPFHGIGRALASRGYRIYWLGQAPHVQGQWIHRMAASWLIYDMTHSPAWLGAIGFALSAPHLALSPFAGALCDRFGHRRTSILATGAGAAIALATALLTYAALLTPAILFGLVCLLGISTAIEFPARQTLVPTLLDRSVLTEGMALNWAVFNAGFFTGPLIAGVLLTLGGAELAFLVSTLAYFCMVGALVLIPSVDHPVPTSLGLGLIGDIAAGIRYTLGHPVIPWVIGLQIVASLLLRPHVDLMAGFAGAVFHRGEEGLAMLLAASGVGALVVSVAMTLYGRTRMLGPIFIWGAVVSGAGLLAFALTDSFWVALALLAIVGGGLTATGIANVTMIQHEVEAGFRGRVVSINMACQLGMPALGALALGWIAEFLGLQIALAAAGAVALAAMALTGRILLRKGAAR